jgi:hypothetical protein
MNKESQGIDPSCTAPGETGPAQTGAAPEAPVTLTAEELAEIREMSRSLDPDFLSLLGLC